MNIKRQLFKNASWTILISLTYRGFGFISMMILARVLVPRDFGLVAMAMVFVALLRLINTSTFQVFLVQKKNLSSQDLDTAWTLQILVTVLQSLVLAALSIPVAWLYGTPPLIAIILALSGTLFISAFKNIGVMYFQRDMRFHFEFIMIACQKIASVSVTITLAFLWRSYWALIVGSMTERLTELLLSYLLHPYRPRLQLSGWRKLMQFSKWLYGNNLLFFLAQRGPEFLIGKICGPALVGLFSMSYEIAMLPTTDMVAPINRAVFPGYARMSTDPEQLRDGYLSVLGMVALVSLPAAIGIAGSSKILIPLLLGHKWLQAVPLVQMLAIGGALGSLQTNAGAVYLGQGKPWIITRLTLLRNGIFLPSLIALTATSGVKGAAMAYLITELAMNPVGFAVIKRVLKLGIWNLLSTLYRPFFCAGVMYFAVRCLISGLQPIPGISMVLIAIIVIFAGAVIYIGGVTLIWTIAGRPLGAEATLLNFARERVIRLHPLKKGVSFSISAHSREK